MVAAAKISGSRRRRRIHWSRGRDYGRMGRPAAVWLPSRPPGAADRQRAAKQAASRTAAARPGGSGGQTPAGNATTAGMPDDARAGRALAAPFGGQQLAVSAP